MKIATFNINDVNKRLANLIGWLRAEKPDVSAWCLLAPLTDRTRKSSSPTASVARPMDPAPLPEPTARGSRSTQSPQQLATSAAAEILQ